MMDGCTGIIHTTQRRVQLADQKRKARKYDQKDETYWHGGIFEKRAKHLVVCSPMFIGSIEMNYVLFLVMTALTILIPNCSLHHVEFRSGICQEFPVNGELIWLMVLIYFVHLNTVICHMVCSVHGLTC